MICPACKSSLYKKTLHGLEVVTCSQCQGFWLDEKTLKKAIDQNIAKNQIKPSDSDALFEPRDIVLPDKLKNIRLCPQCSAAMAKLNYAYNSNIILDKCNGCGGIWTDRGKFKAIAKYATPNPRLNDFSKKMTRHKTIKSPGWELIDGSCTFEIIEFLIEVLSETLSD